MRRKTIAKRIRDLEYEEEEVEDAKYEDFDITTSHSQPLCVRKRFTLVCSRVVTAAHSARATVLSLTIYVANYPVCLYSTGYRREESTHTR